MKTSWWFLCLVFVLSSLDCAQDEPRYGAEPPKETEIGVVNAPHEQGMPSRVRPDSAQALGLDLSVPEAKVYSLGERIQINVTLTNRSDSRMLLCVPNWELQKGIVSFEVYDPTGVLVKKRSGIHVDYYIEDEDLQVLEPHQAVDGFLDLTKGGTVFDFGKGHYRVVGKYFCPVDGERVVEGEVLPVNDRIQYSEPVSIAVDYALGSAE